MSTKNIPTVLKGYKSVPYSLIAVLYYDKITLPMDNLRLQKMAVVSQNNIFFSEQCYIVIQIQRNVLPLI